MPQFVRLVNTPAQGTTTNNIRNGIRDQLILPEYAKVSLVDCNVRFANSVTGEQFTAQGEQIQFTLGSNSYTVTMPADYSDQTSFLNAVRDNLNYQNTITAIGALQAGYLDWDYTLNDNTVTYQMGQVSYNTSPDYSQGVIDPSPAPAGSTLGSGEIQTPDTDSLKYVSKDHLTRGRWKLRARYNQTNANVKWGAILDSDGIYDGSTFMGLYIPAIGTTNYEFYYNNASVLNLGVAPANNDTVQIIYQGGQVHITIDSGAGVNKYNNTLTLSAYGATDEVLASQKRSHYVTFTPTGTTGLTGGFTSATATEAIQSNFMANTATITWSRTLATYLGYNDNSIKKTSFKGQPLLYPADDKVAGDKTSQGILVTLEGVGRVGSFDGPSGATSDVIAVIPETANIVGTNDVVHTTPYRYNLELNNATPLRVNNLIVRFRTRLDQDPLQVRPGSMVTLLFE